MSTEADIIQNKRRWLARPNGMHDRIVRVLAIGLPALIGALAAVMILAPLAPRGEVSFLLDRNKVAVAEDRLKVNNAMYRGKDNKGRPFSLRAGEAVQRSASEPLVRLRDLEASILLEDGPAELSAATGRYQINEERVSVDGVVHFEATNGYRLDAQNVSVNLKTRAARGEGRVEGSDGRNSAAGSGVDIDIDNRRLVTNSRFSGTTPGGSLAGNSVMVDLIARRLESSGRVQGNIPGGSWSADRMIADLDERRLRLNGNVKLRLVPGQIRIPNP